MAVLNLSETFAFVEAIFPKVYSPLGGMSLGLVNYITPEAPITQRRGWSVFLTSEFGVGSKLRKIVMRGIDTTGAYRYWETDVADGAAIAYSGPNKPLTDVCVFKSY
jgi:hypothetical protein